MKLKKIDHSFIDNLEWQEIIIWILHRWLTGFNSFVFLFLFLYIYYIIVTILTRNHDQHVAKLLIWQWKTFLGISTIFQLLLLTMGLDHLNIYRNHNYFTYQWIWEWWPKITWRTLKTAEFFVHIYLSNDSSSNMTTIFPLHSKHRIM